MNIGSNGLFTFRLDGIRVQTAAPDNRKLELRLNGVVYTGFITFAEIGEGRYRPAGGKGALIGTPVATMQVSGGRRTDISATLRRFLPASGTPGGNVTFVCSGSASMEYQIAAGGQTVTYKFGK
jgi:hypothetical protein